MKQNEIRSALRESVIHIVAQDGLENTTTKKIAQRAGLNEVYIYRVYQDKQDLMRQIFLLEDFDFIQEILNQCSVMGAQELSPETQYRAIWTSCWSYLMERPDSCLFYVRYFYSANFDEAVQKKHQSFCKHLLQQLNISEALLHQILEMVWVFSSKVALGIWENDPQTAEDCFCLLYGMCQSARRMAVGQRTVHDWN